MHYKSLSILLVHLLFTSLSYAQILRPSAYPLITHDPYFSVWSTTDKLTDSPTRHSTGKPQSLEGIVRVDGKAYQFLGAVPTTYDPILPTGETKTYTATYTLTKPAEGWEKPDFDATSWKSALGPFGDTPEARTPWRNSQTDKDGIYVRREFTYDGKTDPSKLLLSLNHDDAVDVFLNGIKVLSKSGHINEYIYLPLPAEAQNALKIGKNVLAVHCVSPRGGSFVDVGIVNPIISTAIAIASQTGVTVTATQTDYTFTAGPVDLRVNFLSPLLLDELEVVARPVSYKKTEATSGLTTAEKQRLTTATQALWQLLVKIDQTGKKLETYVRLADYQRDNLKQSDALMTEVQGLFSQFSQERDAFYKQIQRIYRRYQPYLATNPYLFTEKEMEQVLLSQSQLLDSLTYHLNENSPADWSVERVQQRMLADEKTLSSFGKAKANIEYPASDMIGMFREALQMIQGVKGGYQRLYVCRQAVGPAW